MELANQDVVENILSFMPVRSLLRLRTLNKFLCKIIQSSAFSKLQFHKQINNTTTTDDDSVCLVITFLEGRISMSFVDNRNSGQFRSIGELFKGETGSRSRLNSVAGPANGLICFYRNCMLGVSPLINQSIITVCNPSRLKIDQDGAVEPVSLLTPSYSSSCEIIAREIAIGFVNKVQDYKILEVLICTSHGKQHAQLYTRSTDSWRDLAFDYDLWIYMRVKSSSANTSFAHWIADLNTVGSAQHVMLSFDMENEVFGITVMPELKYTGRSSKWVFVKDDGSFILISKLIYDSNPTRLNIHKSRREGNELYWDFVKMIGPFPFPTEPIPQAIWKDSIVLKEREKMYFVNICSEELIACPQKSEAVNTFMCIAYKPSLIFP